MTMQKADGDSMAIFVVSENEHTANTLRAKLEQLFVAAGYIDAGQGNMKIAMHLIDAAMAELEDLERQRPRPHISVICNEKSLPG